MLKSFKERNFQLLLEIIKRCSLAQGQEENVASTRTSVGEGTLASGAKFGVWDMELVRV